MTAPDPALLAPIPGDNPAGISLRYDSVYDQIKVARREDDDLPQGDWQTSRKVADWPLVIRLASDALARKSKDLQLGAWLTEAWLRRDGFAGFHRGLDLLREMLQQFWDSVHPVIDDGDLEMRAAPLEWIGLKFELPIKLVPLNQNGHSLVDYRVARSVPSKEVAESDSSKGAEREQAILEGKPTPEDFEAAFQGTPKAWYKALVMDIDACSAALTGLEQFCGERFGEFAPSMAPARAVVQEVRQIAAQLLARKLESEPDPPGESTDLTAVASGGTGTEAAAGGGRMANLAAGPATGDEAALWIAAAARQIRRDRPTEPTAYLLLRGFRWGELRSADGRLDPKMLVAPITELRTRLKSLLLDASWLQLLSAAEEVLALPAGRGWLDLQRYALTACDGLGSEYESVGSAIRGALRALLADIPDLPAQTLMDDSPTANAETMAWLASQKLLPDGSEVAEAPEQLRSTAPRRDAFEVAQARVRGGDARGAMELLMRESEREKSTRARFLRRSQAAEIMVGAGMEPVALPILRELMDQIESFRLEEWEAGDTVARPLGLLYQCAVRLGNAEVDVRALYDRVCRLDPVRAIQINGGRENAEGS